MNRRGCAGAPRPLRAARAKGAVSDNARAGSARRAYNGLIIPNESPYGTRGRTRDRSRMRRRRRKGTKLGDSGQHACRLLRESSSSCAHRRCSSRLGRMSRAARSPALLKLRRERCSGTANTQASGRPAWPPTVKFDAGGLTGKTQSRCGAWRQNALRRLRSSPLRVTGHRCRRRRQRARRPEAVRGGWIARRRGEQPDERRSATSNHGPSRGFSAREHRIILSTSGPGAKIATTGADPG